ncbi:MAG TPA: hypothetical protein VFP93_05425, partial [Gammaproteobacteria bacterium]|nr:hypothetical protein [Gammaproteobacteria bacterium]
MYWMFWATPIQDISKWESLSETVSLEEKLQMYDIKLYSDYENAHKACNPHIDKGVIKVSVPALQSEMLNQKEFEVPAYQIHYENSLFEHSDAKKIKSFLEKVRVAKHQADIAEAKGELKELHDDIDALEENIEKLTQEIEVLNKKIDKKNNELAKKNTELTQKNAELAQKDEILEMKESEIKTAKEQNKSYAKASQDLNNAIFGYQTELEFKKRHLEELEKRAQEMEKRAQEIEKQVQIATNEKHDLESKLTTVEKNYKTITHEQQKHNDKLEQVIERLSYNLSETESELTREKEFHSRALQKTAALKWQLLNAANHFHVTMEKTLNNPETESEPSTSVKPSFINNQETIVPWKHHQKTKQPAVKNFIAKNSFESSAALAGIALYCALDGISATTGAL